MTGSSPLHEGPNTPGLRERSFFSFRPSLKQGLGGPSHVQVPDGQASDLRLLLSLQAGSGALFMRILAVKHRSLTQTGNLHSSHSLARAKAATESAVQAGHLWNVDVHPVFLLLTMLPSPSSASSGVIVAHLPEPVPTPYLVTALQGQEYTVVLKRSTFGMGTDPGSISKDGGVLITGPRGEPRRPGVQKAKNREGVCCNAPGKTDRWTES